MAITPDKDPINIITSTIVKDAAEKVGKAIKKKIAEGTILVDPFPGLGSEILKVHDKLSNV